MSGNQIVKRMRGKIANNTARPANIIRLIITLILNFGLLSFFMIAPYANYSSYDNNIKKKKNGVKVLKVFVGFGCDIMDL